MQKEMAITLDVSPFIFFNWERGHTESTPGETRRRPAPSSAQHPRSLRFLALIGKFTWSNDAAPMLPLSRAQFDALVLGLPWQRVGEAGIIGVI